MAMLEAEHDDGRKEGKKVLPVRTAELDYSP
jgi:hypothetical protein